MFDSRDLLKVFVLQIYFTDFTPSSDRDTSQVEVLKSLKVKYSGDFFSPFNFDVYIRKVTTCDILRDIFSSSILQNDTV